MLDPGVHRSERREMGGPSLGSSLRTDPISAGADGESPTPGSTAHSRGGACPPCWSFTVMSLTGNSACHSFSGLLALWPGRESHQAG